MARALTAALITELESSSLRPAIWFKMELDSGDVLFWSGSGNKSFGGDTYTGLGDLTGLEFPEENSSGVSNGLSVSISGIPSTSVSLALENYQNRLATIWFGCLDDSENIIADPYKIFAGFVDTMVLDDDGKTGEISIRIEGYSYGVGPSNIRYTNEDQKRTYATDTGLQYVRSLSEKAVYWGTAGSEVLDPAYRYPDNWSQKTDLDGDGEYDVYIP